MNGERYGKSVLRVRSVLLLFVLKHEGVFEAQVLTYGQYMKIAQIITVVKRTFGCVCLRWVTKDEEDRTLDIAAGLHENKVKAGVYYGLVPFGCIVSLEDVLQSNIRVHWYTPRLRWPRKRFQKPNFYNLDILQLTIKSKPSDAVSNDY